MCLELLNVGNEAAEPSFWVKKYRQSFRFGGSSWDAQPDNTSPTGGNGSVMGMPTISSQLGVLVVRHSAPLTERTRQHVGGRMLADETSLGDCGTSSVLP